MCVNKGTDVGTNATLKAAVHLDVNAVVSMSMIVGMRGVVGDCVCMSMGDRLRPFLRSSACVCVHQEVHGSADISLMVGADVGAEMNINSAVNLCISECVNV